MHRMDRSIARRQIGGFQELGEDNETVNGCGFPFEVTKNCLEIEYSVDASLNKHD